MTNFEKCLRAYEIGATKEQIKVWVKANKISTEEYKQITGQDYTIGD